MISLTDTAKKLILNAFSKAETGSLLLVLPDGTARHFGKVNTPPEVSLTVKDETFFKDLMIAEDIGLGESFESGKWTTDNLTGFIQWLLVNTRHFGSSKSPWVKKTLRSLLMGLERLRHFRRRNSLSQSRQNIQFHYDLGNPFYESFLDQGMTYSSAFYTDEEQSLEDAQHEKYDRLCRKLNLQPGLRILEIGTGWGGFALHAATHYGCHVTTTTISQRQYEYALEKIVSEGMQNRIELKLEDYRNLEGRYDRIVSIEMMEAVGHRYLPTYFEKCFQLLKEDGLAAYQVILSANSHYDKYRNSVDWIRKHIFPGGHLPSLNAIHQVLSKSGIPWDLYHSETFALHYARTLKQWQTRFNRASTGIRELGVTESFRRKWNFYLSYCEAAFLERHVNVAQLVYGRPDISSFSLEEISPSFTSTSRLKNPKAMMAS